MNNKSAKYHISILISITIASIFMSSISFTYSQIAYSTSLPSLSESLEESQRDLQSLINKEVQQTITNTVEDIANGNNNGNSNGSNINDINSENISQQPINATETKKVTVGDIDIAYKMFGKGDPILFIPGFSMTMEMWGPILNDLSENHTVITFDNRGIGETTAGNKSFSMEQFVNDTSGLIDALEIDKPIDVLGLSLGGMIAQEFSLSHPEKIKHLVVVASSCGGEESLPPQLSPKDLLSMQTGTANKSLFLHALFPDKWIQENSDQINRTFALPQVSQENLLKYGEALSKWKGSCDGISSINKPVLVLAGTEDITSPPINSLKIAEKIPSAWLIQIEDGGHGVMQQYPEKMVQILNTFFETTN